MPRVSVRIWASLGGLFGQQTTSKRVLEVEVGDGSTLLDLLRSLGDAYPRFGGVMFDPSGEPSDQISVVLNDRLPELLDGLGTALHDGDRVILVQAYAGG
jgi:molybdopterin converting factor small subunit